MQRLPRTVIHLLVLVGLLLGSFPAPDATAAMYRAPAPRQHQERYARTLSERRGVVPSDPGALTARTAPPEATTRRTLFLPLLARNTQPAATYVGPDGGVVRSADGSAEVRFPPGALPAGGWVELDTAPADLPPLGSNGRGWLLGLRAADGSPIKRAAGPFSLGVRATGPGAAAIVVYDAEAGAWRGLPTDHDEAIGLHVAAASAPGAFRLIQVGAGITLTRATFVGGQLEVEFISATPNPRIHVRRSDSSTFFADEAGPGKFVVPNAGGGVVRFHISDNNNLRLPFTGFPLGGDYSYRVAAGVADQPLWVGQGAGSDGLFQAFLTKYRALSGPATPGPATDLVHQWDTFNTQSYAAPPGGGGSVIIQNPYRCGMLFQVRGDVLGAYINAGGPGNAALGPPISDELTAPPEYVTNTGEPLGLFRHGIITRQPGGSMGVRPHHPQLGPARLSAVANPPSTGLVGTLTIQTRSLPGRPPQTRNLDISTAPGSTLVSRASDTYTATLNAPLAPGQSVSIAVEASPDTEPTHKTRAVYTFTLPTAQPYNATSGSPLLPDPSTATNDPVQCASRPPADTTPPVIVSHAVIQDGKGGVLFTMKVTDDRRVASVSVTLDGATTYTAASLGGDQYEVLLPSVPLGKHTYTINALDTAGNAAVPVNGEFKLERSDSYGIVASIGYSQDPVNTLIGNFIYNYVDLSLPEPGADITIDRFYNGQSSYVGLFGRGWTTLFDISLFEMNNSLFRGAIVRYADGRTANFPTSGAGFSRPAGIFDSLARNGAGYRLTAADQTVYHFNAGGRLVEIADSSGNWIRATYNGARLAAIGASSGTQVTVTSDSLGRVTKLDAPAGISLTYSYDTQGRLLSVDDGSGAVTYHYDPDNGIVRIGSPDGHDFLDEQQFDGQGRVISQRIGGTFINRFEYLPDRTIITDAYNNRTTYVYDKEERLIEVIDAQPSSERYTYNGDDQRARVTDRNGHTTTYQYDAAGNRIKETDHDGNSNTWTYNAQRRMTSATDKRGHTTTYSYDTLGRLILIVAPLNQRTEMRYNSAGQIIEQISPRGASTTYQYDAAGRLVEMRDDLGAVTRYEYDQAGRRIAEINPNGGRRGFAFDTRGNLLEESDPLGGTTRYRYDRNNNRVGETDASGATTAYTYTRLGKLETTTHPDGGVETLLYDDMGNRTGYRDQLGNLTTWTLDTVYRVVTETNPLGATTAYTYDAVGNRTSVTDPRGFTTTYAYDALNRVALVTDPFGGTVALGYDATGNLITRTDPLGAVTAHAYDALNRLVRLTDPTGAITLYEYDGHGNRTRITDALGNVTEREYDARNRLIRETNPLGHSTLHSYDGNGNRVLTQDARGFQTRSSYDALDRLVSVTDALGRETRYRYDAVGNRVAEIDALGAVTRTSYDPMRRPVERIDSLGHATRTSYDLAGRPVRVTDANGNATVSRYDAAGRLVSVTDPLGLSERYSYDPAGNRVEVVDRNGTPARFEYDALNRIVAQTDGRGATTRFHYDLAGNEVARIDAAGHITRYAYDPAGRQIESVDPLGNATRSSYDDAGRLVALTRPDGATLASRYDAAGQLVASIDGAGHTTRYSYDETGNRVSSTAPGGQVVTTSYDALARPVEVRDGLGPRQRFAYDAVGNRVSVADGSGAATSYRYDMARRVVEVRDAAGRATAISYDPAGNQGAVVGPDGATTRYSYDRRGQLVAETDPNGNTTRYSYDGVGRRTGMTDALGVSTRWEYDGAGNLSAVTLNVVPDAQPGPAVNVTTRFSYDALGNRTAIISPNGHTTTFIPDPLGRLVAEVDPLGYRTEYVYDVLGREVERREANGGIVRSAYDRADRLVETHYVAEGERVGRRYDERGLLVELTDSSGATNFTYDERGRLVAERSARGELRYRYDAADRRAALIYPSGVELTYTYSEAGELEQVVTPDGAATTFERDAVGRVVRQISGNGTQTEHHYDAAGNLLATATRRGGPDGPLIAGVAYTYNVIDQRSAAVFTDSRGRETREEYRQDPLRRLVAVQTSAGVSMSYAYDAAGNRTAWATGDDPRTPTAGDGVAVSFRYDAADQLVEMSGGGATVRYRYDESGNRIERAGDGARTLYRYDSANRLVELREQRAAGGDWRDETIVTMERDGLGRRVSRRIDDAGDGAGARGWHYLHAGLDVVATQAIGGGEGSLLFRADEGRPFAEQRGGQSAYFTQDALGSTLALSGGDGQALADYRYDSYGIPTAGGATTSFTYTGQEYDAESGLYHFHARAYDPETATWLGRDPYRGDPADPQSLHRYGYVQGNPINLRDAYGYAAKPGTYSKVSAGIELPGFIELLIELSKSSGRPRWERKIEGPKIPDNWPLPSAVKDPITRFLPNVEAGAYVDYGFSDSRKFETYISGNTIAVGEKVCRTLEAEAYAYVKADLWKGSVWVVEASAGLGAALGLEGEAKGCLAVQFGASFDTPHIIANAGVEVEASLQLVGELKAYVRLRADVFVAYVEGEAGVKATVKYPLLACKWEARFGTQLPSDDDQDCPAAIGDLELGIGVYADIAWGGAMLDDNSVSYEATLATTWIRAVPTLAKLIGWAK